ncbi:glycosyltransferase family 4 protein [Fulvivirga imtechensis]|nr:glycosyltransferase family 4 protein [Fulvivirga imtechensis]
MKIAQISPLCESVPPKAYGGTERVVSYLTEELVRQGHEVTLFASKDSQTKAQLVSTVEQSLRLKEGVLDTVAHHIVQMQEVIERMHEFDILHFHTDYIHFPVTSNTSIPHVTTLHGRLDIPDLQYIYNKFKNQPVISISDAQRKPLPHAEWAGTVYHGLPLNLYTKGDGDGDYVVFLGRISPEKAPDKAIEIAQRAGIPIKIAAKIDKADYEYYSQKIKPLFKLPHVEYLGEIGENEKEQLLQKAKALLFPINWPEPFGMVLAEAMACGTPTIAFPNGSVPELVEEGKTGLIVHDTASAASALKNIDALDRDLIRNTFEKRFSVQVMADNYLYIYDNIINKKGKSIELPVNGQLSIGAKRTIASEGYLHINGTRG